MLRPFLTALLFTDSLFFRSHLFRSSVQQILTISVCSVCSVCSVYSPVYLHLTASLSDSNVGNHVLSKKKTVTILRYDFIRNVFIVALIFFCFASQTNHTKSSAFYRCSNSHFSMDSNVSVFSVSSSASAVIVDVIVDARPIIHLYAMIRQLTPFLCGPPMVKNERTSPTTHKSNEVFHAPTNHASRNLIFDPTDGKASLSPIPRDESVRQNGQNGDKWVAGSVWSVCLSPEREAGARQGQRWSR